MRTLYYILQKEFLLIFRDRTILRLIFIMPVMQLIIIPLAADYEVRDLAIAVVDLDHSSSSRALIHKVSASNYFRVVDTPANYDSAITTLERGTADIVLTIPKHFDRDLGTLGRTSLHLAADAVDGVRAGLGTSYVLAMVRQFQRDRADESPIQIRAGPVIEVTSANCYNPHGNYPSFMVPGLLAILVTLVGSFLTALNIVQEKEAGTIEQINVSPIAKYQFILGKLIPFWLLGMISITIGLGVGLLVFGLWPAGSLLTMYAFSGVYLVGVLGIGLFISTLTESQQQATLMAFFFMMIFVLLSGLYTPVESMPGWAQNIAAANPPAYFVEVMRAIYIKGSTLGDLWPTMGKLVAFAVFFNILAVWNYKKRSA